MSTPDTYDVAVIGYGPTGATAANLLGQLGLKVLVIERDPDVYSRARAISTDEEVMRIWQSVGLDERLQRDMLPDRPLTFVDAHGVPFIDLKVHPRGAGHPPQQFLYQPAVDHVLRDGVQRFASVDVLLEHECLRVHPTDDRVELMLADLRTDTLKRVHARLRHRRRRRLVADPGPTRSRLHRADLQRALGRHRHQGATGMGRSRPVALSLQPGPADRRLSDSPGPPSLGIPFADRRTRTGVASRRGDLEGAERSGHHRREC